MGGFFFMKYPEGYPEVLKQLHGVYCKWADFHGYDSETEKVFNAFTTAFTFAVQKCGWKKYGLELAKDGELYLFNTKNPEEKAQLCIDIR